MAWRSLWAMVVGFFMILVDSTIVTVATPTIMRELNANVTSVVWVTSAYLLAYAVPLLITGRLGDRFGPKRVYLIGLVVFTLASLGCGLTTTIELLIAARVVQGLGAALMTPQTMTVITRVFPPHQRGTAMAVWGATAGLAMLVGPMLGGLLIGLLGWEWIFFINIPIGAAGYVAAHRLVPDLEQHPHRFDWLGVALSGIGLFCIVFGLQEASTHDWGAIAGPVSVGSLLVAGVCFLAAFVVWQRFNPNEPLMPLKLFGDRNFSVANLAIALVGMTSVATPYPLMIWAQQARGLSPLLAALVNAPSAVVTLIVAKWSGQLVNRVHPRYLTVTGGLVWAFSLLAAGHFLDTTTPVWVPVVLLTFTGVASSLVFGPLSTAATANLPITYAGAGSGVYNATRQVGSVLGSAVVATVMNTLSAVSGQTPDGIASAMSGTLLLPAASILAVAVIACFLERPKHQRKN
jgi:drug resistance MFS transporter, drug:H+ antiporter-2 family